MVWVCVCVGTARCVKRFPHRHATQVLETGSGHMVLSGSVVPASAVTSWCLSKAGRLTVWGRNLVEGGDVPSPGSRERAWWR